MPNNPESPRRPTSAQGAHLQYPTLPPLSASVEEWLSRSRPANTMDSDRLDVTHSKSLSESWATLSVSDLHSEDGTRSEQTDVGSLIDQTTPDDVASLDERYSSSELENPDDFHGHDEDDAEDEHNHNHNKDISDPRLFPSALFHRESAIDDSALTARPTLRQSIDSIEFVEPESWAEKERVELKHTISIVEDDMTAGTGSKLPSTPEGSMIVVTVQQTMTRQTLDLDKPFRVLYYGNSEVRDIVLDKLGDVLVSSPSTGSPTSSAESSRYHVVPTSFGAGAVPSHAELLPINVQLVVDECVDATCDVQDNTIDLLFKNRNACRSWWDRDHYRISSASEWTLPGVAILFISKHDSPAVLKGRRLIHMFLERHGVPSMIISDEQLWHTTDDFISLNPDSLHMCLESRNIETGESTVLKRYPIDLKTFESITPGQMNRNLASLIDLQKKKNTTVPMQPESETDYRSWISNGYRSWIDHSWFDIEKYPGNWLRPMYSHGGPELGSILRLLTVTLVTAIGMSIGYAALKVVLVFWAQWVAGSTLSTSIGPGAVPAAIETGALTLESIHKNSLSIRPPSTLDIAYEDTSGLSLVDQVAELAIASQSSPIDPDAFEIHAIGDCHVLIKPPRNLASAKKRRRFDVDVSRDGSPLPNELSQLFEGVYTLRLDREDAYGPINVTVIGTPKFPVQQSVIIDFGTPWLKISNWRRKAQKISSQVTKDLQVAQTGLSDAYGRLTTDLQVVMGDVVKRAHFLKDDAERLRHESSQTRHTILHRSKQYSDTLVSNAIQQFQDVSSKLHHHSANFNREARERVNSAWTSLGDSADIVSMMDRVRGANRAVLDRAQMHARHFMGHSGKEKKLSGKQKARR